MLRRLGHTLANPRGQIAFWAFWTAVWACLMPVTLATHLKTSIEWVVFMSLFANAASCGTALVAALAYYRSWRADAVLTQQKLDRLAEHHGVDEWPQ